jgi:hypothetical protein
MRGTMIFIFKDFILWKHERKSFTYTHWQINNFLNLFSPNLSLIACNDWVGPPIWKFERLAPPIIGGIKFSLGQVSLL